VIDACDKCLRRSYLTAFLATDVERLLPAGRPARAQPLEVGVETLIAALSPRRQADARAFLEGFDPRRTRRDIATDAVCCHSDAFPDRLRDLRHPPAVLYATRLARVPADACAVIGSRRPSEYGRTMGYRIGRGLGAARVPVVSGLALGIDALAHRGCLDGGGLTIAVLASGVDVAYPRTNRALHGRIREDGAIVSEMPPRTRPYRWLFPARNRIMAALGQVTVVVEATERSGTLITADCAAEIGRDVAAVPGPVTSDAAAGTNGLIRAGAALVTGAQDVLDLLYGVGVREVPAEPQRALDPQDQRLLELVSRGAGIDELGDETGLGPGPVRAALARLELRGLIRRAASGSYVPAA
jgi:DNA processing protein